MLMTRHTDSQYEAELAQLSQATVAMAARAEHMVQQAVQALLTGDIALAERVAASDDQLDADELAVDQCCLRLLARRSPVGEDLRLITATIKVVTDFERIGDLAVNIAERTVELARTPGAVPTERVETLAKSATDLLREAMDVFRRRDVGAARKLYEKDRLVDAQNKACFHELLQLGQHEAHAFERALTLASICRHLERIGDHAVNIGERVIFLVAGEDVRHSQAVQR